jgi:hypothetical protein
MNSFTVTAVGNLAKDPELAVKGGTTYTRFCLVGNDGASWITRLGRIGCSTKWRRGASR